jgi:hypothetical protein
MTISMVIQFPGFIILFSFYFFFVSPTLLNCMVYTKLFLFLIYVLIYRFVQFGADQDCHCGSSNCRKMVGTSKSFNSFVLHNGNSGSSQDQHDIKKRKTTSDNCIGEIIRLWDRRDKM